MKNDADRKLETASGASPPREGAPAEIDGEPASTGILLRRLGVRVGGRALLEDVSAGFPRGGITLIVGASGAGKSVFLNILAGLLRPGHADFDIEGDMEIHGRPVTERGSARVGIVFQNFALFDELSATGNVLFGMDHASTPVSSRPTRERHGKAAHLLEVLGVPANVGVSVLSGGQKQRLAIARTLAYDPDVVVYDEPTSGLDPANARRVARLIRSTQEEFGKTTVVVTHDYEHLASIASTVFLLDHHRRTLRRIEPSDLADVSETLADGPGAPVSPPGARGERAREPGQVPGPSRRRWPGRLIRGAGDLLATSTCAAEATFKSLLRLLPTWRSPFWGLRFFWHYLGLLASPSSLIYFGAAGLIAGLVATHFTFKFLPFKAYTEPLITEELLHGLGFSLYRIVIPVLLTVLLAARGGAAIAADIASRSYSRQVDALRSFRAHPDAYLLTNILHACLLATPLLILLGFFVAKVTSLVVFSYNYPQHAPLFWDGHFHRDLRVPGALLYRGSGWMMLKVLLCGFGTGAIAYFQGLRPKSSAVDVSRSITQTIIWATLFVLLVHFAFAFIEF